MAADPQVGALEVLLTLAAKWLPGIGGAAISLRFLPDDASRSHKLSTFAGGAVSAIYAGPAIAEIAHVSSGHVAAGIVFACGLFGLAAIGQFWEAIKQLELGVILRDVVRKVFGLGSGS